LSQLRTARLLSKNQYVLNYFLAIYMSYNLVVEGMLCIVKSVDIQLMLLKKVRLNIKITLEIVFCNNVTKSCCFSNDYFILN